MSTLRNLVSVLIIASLVLESESSKSSNFSRNIELPHGNELVAFTMQNSSLTYISCEGIKKILKDSRRQLSRHCDLKVISHTPDEAIQLSSCPIDIEIDQTAENERMPTARVVQISKTDVLMFWANIFRSDHVMNLKVVTIHLPNCSQKMENAIIWDTHFVEIRHVIEQLLILTHSGRYEVIYDNKDSCKKACSLTFDDQRSKFVAPIEANFTRIVERSGEFVFPARFGSDLFTPGSCILLSSEERLNASMIFNDKVFDLLGFDLGITRRPTISTAHGVLTVCNQDSINTKFLRCSQGNLDEWFDLSFDFKVQGSLVHNLRDGGILTLTVVKKEVERKSYLLRLSRFHPGGKLRSVEDVTDLKCLHGLLYCFYIDLYENDKNEMCVSVFRKVEMVEALSEDQINWLKPRIKVSEVINACYEM